MKKSPNGLYRYRIIKKGKVAYLSYLQRIRRGLELNRLKRVPKHTENYCKYSHGTIKTAQDFDLLPEQLLSYFGVTKHGDEWYGLEKAGQVLGIEQRIKNPGTKPASQIKKEREQKK